MSMGDFSVTIDNNYLQILELTFVYQFYSRMTTYSLYIRVNILKEWCNIILPLSEMKKKEIIYHLY